MPKSNIVRITEHSDSMILNALELKDQRALLSKGRPHSFQKGEIIFARGEEGSWALLIEEGLVEISVMSLSGRKSVLNHMEKGDILGEIALFDHEGRSAEAMALTDVSGTIVNRQSLFEVLNNNNDAYFSIIKTLCARVRNASEMFETLSLTSANARLARCLLRMANKWGRTESDGSIYIDQHFSQSDLGDLAGMARENVNRYLQTWAHEDIIQFEKGYFSLLDIDKLKDFAELQ
jgi:CRP/FNR family cyclic AMP-dependent transcriptional regulator